MVKHPIYVKDSTVFGHIVLETTVDPITKSKPNAKNLRVKNWKLKMDGTPLAWLAWKAGQQIGIDMRAKWNGLKAHEVNAKSNTIETVEVAYAKSSTVVVVDPVAEMGKARVAFRSATDDIAKKAAEDYFRGLVTDMVKDMNDKGFPVTPESIAPDLNWDESSEE